MRVGELLGAGWLGDGIGQGVGATLVGGVNVANATEV